MSNLSFIKDLNCELVIMPFSEWLDIPEPDFFNNPTDEDSFYPNLSRVDALKFWSSVVSIINVEGQRYKLDSVSRRDAWLLGNAEKPDHVRALIFAMSQLDFDSLCEEAHEKYFAALPQSEQVKEIYSDLNMPISSERLKNGLIYDALSLAFTGKTNWNQGRYFNKEKNVINLKNSIREFKEELFGLFHNSIT